MRKVILFVSIFTAALLLASGCAAPAAAQPESDVVTVSLSFEKQKGYASNQFAVWIEDTNGTLIKTLYVTSFTAEGGFEKRPDAIPVWVERAGASTKSETDAASGATPKSGTLRYVWDMTDESGARVPAGTYVFVVEGTMRWKNQVLFSGEIECGGSASSAEAAATYTYLASDDSPALNADSAENAMISSVSAAYIPPK